MTEARNQKQTRLEKKPAEPIPVWAQAMALATAPSATRIANGQRATSHSGSHKFDDRKAWDVAWAYDGADDPRTQRDIHPVTPADAAYIAHVDFWTTSKTRLAHAKVVPADTYATRYDAVLPRDLSLTSEDFSAIATWAVDTRRIKPDQGQGVARTLARACRTSLSFDDETAYVPTHVTYRITRPSRERLRTIAILIDAMLVGAKDQLTNTETVGTTTITYAVTARSILDDLLAATA